MRSSQIATCSLTTLEMLYAARNADEFRELEAGDREALLRDIPVTVAIKRAAITALRDLSNTAPATTASSCPTP